MCHVPKHGILTIQLLVVTETALEHTMQVTSTTLLHFSNEKFVTWKGTKSYEYLY